MTCPCRQELLDGHVLRHLNASVGVHEHLVLRQNVCLVLELLFNLGKRGMGGWDWCD